MWNINARDPLQGKKYFLMYFPVADTSNTCISLLLKLSGDALCPAIRLSNISYLITTSESHTTTNFHSIQLHKAILLLIYKRRNETDTKLFP